MGVTDPCRLEERDELSPEKKTCTKRNLANSVGEFTKPLDLHKKKKMTLCSDDGMSAAGTVSLLSAPLCNGRPSRNSFGEMTINGSSHVHPSAEPVLP